MRVEIQKVVSLKDCAYFIIAAIALSRAEVVFFPIWLTSHTSAQPEASHSGTHPSHSFIRSTTVCFHVSPWVLHAASS